MMHFKLNFLSNIPKSYLPIVLLKKLQIPINNPTSSCSIEKVGQSETNDFNNNQDDSIQLNEYNLEENEEDIISTCYNLEANIQGTQILPAHDHDVMIENENFQGVNDNSRCWRNIESNNYSSTKMTEPEVELLSSGICCEEQGFSDKQVLGVMSSRNNYLFNSKNNKPDEEELQIDVETLSQSDEENNIIEIEDLNNNLNSNKFVKPLDSTSGLSKSNYELLEDHQLSQPVSTIEKQTDRGNRSKFAKNKNKVKSQICSNNTMKSTLQKCPQCNYTSKSNVRRHINTKHSSNRPYKCAHCNYASKTKLILIHHIQAHANENKYKCADCNFSSKNKGILKIHVRIHRNEKKYKCPVCECYSTTGKSLKIHIRTHNDYRPYKCTQCLYAGVTAANLKRHFRTHTGFRPYKCTQCSYASASSGNLKRHALIHTGIRPFSCSICSFRSIASEALKIHMRKHTGQKPYKCSECSYVSACIANLKRHNRTHLKEKPHKCSLCLFATKNLSTFKRHLRTHQVNAPADKKNEKSAGIVVKKSDMPSKHVNCIGKPADKQVYFCYDCKTSFKQKKSLEKHWKSHHYFQKVNNYHCSRCQQVSSCYGTFIRHLQLAH